MTTAGLVLAPGASATRDHPSLVAIEEALGPDGVTVERITLPSSRPGPPVLRRITAAATDLAERTGLAPARVALGGRSFGGRMCSVAVAEGLPARGLVLVSYPLHPPGRPETRRAEHFPALEVPCLFVSGTRDAFATPAELEAAAQAIPGAVTHVWIGGGDHGLRGRDQPVAEAVRDWILVVGAGGPPG